MSSSDPSASNTIDSDRTLLASLRMDAAQAAMYIGTAHDSITARLYTNRLQFYDIFALVNAALNQGRSIDLSAIRSYVERTSDVRADKGKNEHQKLMQLFDFAYEPIDVQAGDVVVLIFQREEMAHDEIVAAVRALIAANPAHTYLVASSERRAQKFGKAYDIPEDHCFFDDYASHWPYAVLRYRPGVNELRSYIFGEAGYFVEAPWNPLDPRAVDGLLPEEVLQLFGPEFVDA